MTASKTVSKNLDAILSQIGNKLGKYQIKNYIFIMIPVIYSAMFGLSYVFTARNLDYRCAIPECEKGLDGRPDYYPDWLSAAVPMSRSGGPARCERFTSKISKPSENETCSSEMFYQNKTEKCDKFVYNSEDITILNDFNLTCDENLWKLTLVGTINNVGLFVGLPISGFISDRFGRRFLMLGGLLLSAVIGLARSFSSNYLWFLLFEFLDPTVSAGAYSSGFILGVEQVSPQLRVLSGSVVASSYAIGESIVGVIAMYTRDWRWFLRYLYLPGVAIVALYWVTPESIRWLVAKGHKDEAKHILRKAAKMNNVHLSEESLNGLDHVEPEIEEEVKSYPLKDIFKSRILLLRMVSCSFCWITCAFVFYGLTLNSVAISGNIYLNFIFAGLIEIPAYFITYLILDRYGRRFSLCGSLLLSGVACLAFIFIPENSDWMRLISFLTGKFGITIAFTVVYVFTTELFPTNLRHSLLGTCSMFGRTGSMIAPQTPLLAEVWQSLPVFLFGTMAVTAGLLALTFPETLNSKLPDTIEEAEHIGQLQSDDIEKEKKVSS